MTMEHKVIKSHCSKKKLNNQLIADRQKENTSAKHREVFNSANFWIHFSLFLCARRGTNLSRDHL